MVNRRAFRLWFSAGSRAGRDGHGESFRHAADRALASVWDLGMFLGIFSRGKGGLLTMPYSGVSFGPCGFSFL